MDSLEDALLNQLQDKFGTRPSLDDSLAVLGVDSVSMAEADLEIEKQYGITVDDTMCTSIPLRTWWTTFRERQRLTANRIN